MFSIVGLGLWDENDMSLKGLEEIKRSDAVYAEFYTNIWRNSIDSLEKITGKKITILKRLDVESSKLLDEAKTRNICLLVSGDPLVATTHVDLVLESKKQGIETRVIHASSIISAVAECGLQIYKFGKTVTIPFPEKTGGVLPQSVYNSIKSNLASGLHTLLLLDIDTENSKNMAVNEGLQILNKMDNENLLKNKKMVVMSKTGSDDQKIAYDIYAELMKIDFELPAVIIVSGKLHFKEEELLKLHQFK